MPWRETSVRGLARQLGVDYREVREKQRLIALIVKRRKARGVSEAALAKKLGVSQARVAQIESGVGTGTVTFDVLFNVLLALGYEYKVVTSEAA